MLTTFVRVAVLGLSLLLVACNA